MKDFNFYKEEGLKEVDLIIDSPISYKVAIKTAEFIRIGSIALSVISIDNLIKIKKRSGRPVDKFDIGELKKIKKLRGKHNV